MRGVHDLGGQPAGPIERSEHERTFFDQRVDAMLRLLAEPCNGHFTVDAMRRAIESLPPDEYFGLGYYERWLRAIRTLVVERGLLTEDRGAAREACAGGPAMTPRLRSGQRVRVSAREVNGHYRTPAYLRGRRGVVVRHLGDYRSPETLAYHRSGLPLLPLYQVEFAFEQVWAERSERGRARIVADIFHHWLEAEEEERS
jgi:nitrile hydratase subunit beta